MEQNLVLLEPVETKEPEPVAEQNVSVTVLPPPPPLELLPEPPQPPEAERMLAALAQLSAQVGQLGEQLGRLLEMEAEEEVAEAPVVEEVAVPEPQTPPLRTRKKGLSWGLLLGGQS